MENLIKYIKQGKGYGLVFILASSIIATTMIMIKAKPIFNEMSPKLTLIAEDFLPITVKNKQIIEPLDTYKRIDVNLGNTNSDKDVFPIVLDTKTTTSDLSKEKLGLFIMKNVTYVISPNDIKKIYYEDGIFDIEKFKQLLQKSIVFFSILSSIILILLHFIQGILIALTSSLLGLAYVKHIKLSNMKDFSQLMRLCSMNVALLIMLNISLKTFFTFSIGFIHILLLTAIFEVVFLNYEKNKEI